MLRHLWWVLGLALVLGGLATVLLTQADPSAYGWFAYTPLRDDAARQAVLEATRTAGSTIVVTGWQVAGGVLATVGLVVLASGVGFRLGRRRARPPARCDDTGPTLA